MGLSGLAFVLQFGYAFARPSSESLFLATHGSGSLPLAWLLVAAGMPMAVLLYNRVAARLELLRLFALVALVSGAAFALLLGLRALWAAPADYLLYTCKDIYIVLLVELFYTLTNSTFDQASARRLYGLFGAIGAAGAIAGNLLVGPVATLLGSSAALGMSVPLLGLLGLGALALARRLPARPHPRAAGQDPSLRATWQILRSSRYLLGILAMVALAQGVVALVDFQFNAVIEAAFPATDQRTRLLGWVYGAISLGTVLLHAASGPLLALLGVPAVLPGVPLLLLAALAGVALAPGLASAAVAKCSTKVLDYTLFRNAKELLYIPLNQAERTLGKSVADMLTYRLAKVSASALILVLVASGTSALALPATAALVVGWGATSVVVARRFAARAGHLPAEATS